jgi:DNA-binding CsgD family transcriptional regulator
MRLGLATLLLVTLAVALWTIPSGAHDSKAPRGAHHHWLPNEAWSHKHWVPYDESRLYALLGIDTPTLFKWLADDHHTLAQLARRRGVNPRTLARRLMAPRRSSLSAAKYRVLLERAERTVTEGHLAQHVFFHVFHGSHLNGHETGHITHLFGVSRAEYNRLRQKGLSPFEIAERNGRDTDTVRGHVIEALHEESARGVAEGAMTRAQGDRMLARQLRVVECWLTRPLAKNDPENPFGDTWGWHGPHARSVRNGTKNQKTPRGCWAALPAA